MVPTNLCGRYSDTQGLLHSQANGIIQSKREQQSFAIINTEVVIVYCTNDAKHILLINACFILWSM